MKVILCVAALTSGCAMNFQNMSSNELCRQYLTLPSYNVYQAARGAELERRGETCGTTPAGAAAAQRQADQRVQDAMRAGQPPRPVTCNTTYSGNQAYTTCR